VNAPTVRASRLPFFGLLLSGGVATGALLAGPLHFLPFVARVGAEVGVLAVLWLWVPARMLPPAEARRHLLQQLLLLSTLAACAGLAEAGLRLGLRSVTTTSADQDYFSRRWFRTHPFHRNRQGFFERDYAPFPAAGVFRIAVIGDSFTDGRALRHLDDRLSNRLEARLNTSGARFEVLNFGHGGASTSDEVAVLRDFVLDAHPDFVLLQWYVNDAEPADHAGRPHYAPLAPSERASGWLDGHSALYFLAERAWTNLQVRLGMRETYAQYLARLLRDPDGPHARAAEGALEEFIALAREHDVPLGIFLFPTLAEDWERNTLGFLMDRVLAVCARHDVPCVDLRRDLSRVAPRDLWANPFDPHPGPLANRIATDALLERFGATWRRRAVADDRA
jgi:lysophospholipase L1-like esterase